MWNLEIVHQRHVTIEDSEMTLYKKESCDNGNKDICDTICERFSAKAALQICRKILYECGNKCGRMLARSLRKQKLATYIPYLILPNSPKFTMPHDIAIGTTKPGKAPGPDGFTIQYKALLPSLMVKLFNTVGSTSSFAVDTLQAHISVIPKEGKDPASCGSYRPISLINIELKLFRKILKTRIQQHLPHQIHLDQVGFVPTRESRDNTTKGPKPTTHIQQIPRPMCVSRHRR